MVKAIALVSGGLDSLLAAKLVKDQGIKVICVYFETPFHSGDSARKSAEKNCERMGLPLRVVGAGKDYLEMIENPKHGYGSGMNPCVDCRIYFLRKAGELAKELGAEFVVTGEVVGQRPMSQHMRQLKIVEREAGLEGKLLRPLSAKLLPPTEPERKGRVDREKLLDIRGRSRRKQMELAEKWGIKEYLTPAGGCLLTEKAYSMRLKDLLEHKELDEQDCLLLKLGRHFRLGENKVIVGRNEEENDKLVKLKGQGWLFEVPDIGSPITLLQGPKNKKAIELAAALTARYSDSEGRVGVRYGKNLEKEIVIKPANEKQIQELMLK